MFLIVALAVVACLCWYTKSRALQFPGPMGIPYFGIFFKLFYHTVKMDVDVFIDDLFTKYGDMVEFTALGTRYILTKDVEFTRRALKDLKRNDSFSKALADLTPSALFALPSGDKWKFHRKAIQPGFAPAHLKVSWKATHDTVTELISCLGDRKTVNVSEIAGAVSLNVIGLTAFGYDFKSIKLWQTDRDNKIAEKLTMIAETAEARYGNPQILWKYFTKDYMCKEIIAFHEMMKSLIDPMIKQRKNCDTKDMDLLDRLLTNHEFSEKEIYDEILGFFMAGQETSSSAMTNVILALGLNQHIQQKLANLLVKEQSIEQILGNTYLDKVIKETLRRYTVVPFVERECHETFDYDSKHVSEKTEVLISIQNIHLHPNLWDKPLEFNPDRWNNEIQPGSFIPFGDGPRNCIGSKMAISEIKIFTALIVQNYEILLVPGQDPKFKVAITNRLTSPLFATFIKRNNCFW